MLNARFKKQNSEINLDNIVIDEQYENELKRKLESGIINEAQYRTLSHSADQVNDDMENDSTNDMASISSNAFVIDNGEMEPYIAEVPEAIGGKDNPFIETAFMSEDELIDLGADLTHDDKIYLAMKWGRFYRPSEWVTLEQDYNQYMKSFDIQDADTKNSLLELCKVNLKAHQALDSGDIDAFQKLVKAQESLRKTAKFTAAQMKEENRDAVSCVGELVMFCEEYGGAIPKDNSLDVPRDYVDIEMKDTQGFIRTLVSEDPTIAAQIDAYIKKREIAQEQNKNDEKNVLEGKDGLDISEEDYLDFSNGIAEQLEEDAASVRGQRRDAQILEDYIDPSILEEVSYES